MAGQVQSIGLADLPPEIVGEIVDRLAHHADLSRFSKTSSSFRRHLLRPLYKDIRIPVPLLQSRLRSLRQLLASETEGTQYIQSIAIVPKHDHIDKNDATATSHEEKYSALYPDYVPDTRDFGFINYLVRKLISKIPKNQIRSFRWEILYRLEPETLEILHTSHKVIELVALNNIELNKQGPSFGCLSRLETECPEMSVGEDPWQYRSLVRSHRTLRHLRLENKDCNPGNINHESLLPTLRDVFMREAPTVLQSIDTLKLETLHLCRIDLQILIPNFGSNYEGPLDFSYPTVDWNYLVTLRMESCDNLRELFIQFQDQPTFPLTNLQAFILEHEDSDLEFHDSLENFLVHLSPLGHLHVLLNRSPSAKRLVSILEVHGSRLRSLVWDEKGVNLKPLYGDSLIGHLGEISRYCPKLEAVGTSWDWSSWIPPAEFQDIMVHNRPPANLPTTDLPARTMAEQLVAAVASLPKLKTMHIRNCPKTHVEAEYFPYESLYQSLAEQLYHALPTSSPLKNIGFNPLNIRYDWIGSNFSQDPEETLEFIKFRLYHSSSRLEDRDTKPRLVAKGVCDEAEGVVEHLSMFRLFWGSPRNAWDDV